MRQRDNLEDPRVDRRLISKWIIRKFDGRGVYVWNDLTHNRDKWRGLVNEVTKNRFP